VTTLAAITLPSPAIANALRRIIDRLAQQR
jgi:hypothetical protein